MFIRVVILLYLYGLWTGLGIYNKMNCCTIFKSKLLTGGKKIFIFSDEYVVDNIPIQVTH